jgi:hypothetical protein
LHSALAADGCHHDESRQRHAENMAERIMWGQIERQDVAPRQNRHQRDSGIY